VKAVSVVVYFIFEGQITEPPTVIACQVVIEMYLLFSGEQDNGQYVQQTLTAWRSLCREADSHSVCQEKTCLLQNRRAC
jgi:hypothetical protein